MYIALNKRQLTGKLLAGCNFKDGSFVNLIKLDKPYKNGISYSVYETTNNAFCSSGIFDTFHKAIEKYNLMIKNNKKEGIRNQFISDSKEILKYLHKR